MVIIELPICTFSYSSHELKGTGFIKQVNDVIDRYYRENRPFFAALCNNCYINHALCPLKQCGGCQLVGYCNRSCQKEDRSRHKYVCKEFPVVSGKNVLCTTGSWENHIADLRERAARIPHAKPIFFNPRVCSSCWEARQDRLTDCECGTVSYCSKRCIKVDNQHAKHCASLGQIGTFNICIDYPSLIPKLSSMTDCTYFMPVSCWEDILPSEYISAIQDLIAKEGDHSIIMEESSRRERFSYSMSLLFALQAIPGRCLSKDACPLEEITSLEVHVVTSIPLFDSEIWELFMHRLPKLKHLSIVFVMQGREFRNSFSLIKNMAIHRCHNCTDKKRVVTYSVHQMLYHMFFSSPEYTEPDVVVVYGNDHEMPVNGKEVVHNEISYRNMTHSRDTVLVLMDATKDLVIQGFKVVKEAQSVSKLVEIQHNPLYRASTNRTNIDAGSVRFNEKSYFTCLRRK